VPQHFVARRNAETLTLTCKFEGSDQANTQREIQDVNQLFIDSEVPLLNFALRKPWGPNNPMYFGLQIEPPGARLTIKSE